MAARTRAIAPAGEPGVRKQPRAQRDLLGVERIIGRRGRRRCGPLEHLPPDGFDVATLRLHYGRHDEREEAKRCEDCDDARAGAYSGHAGHPHDRAAGKTPLSYRGLSDLSRASSHIFAIVLLDVIALGIVIPVLPKLIETMLGGDTPRAAEIFGYFGTAWALMQFTFSPILGALSDRFGRRPVLLISMAGHGLDYILMALAPSLAWLFVGRIVSGITAASFSTAYAYIADVTPPDKRAGAFGMVGAAFGVGFVLGPALGGVLGADRSAPAVLGGRGLQPRQRRPTAGSCCRSRCRPAQRMAFQLDAAPTRWGRCGCSPSQPAAARHGGGGVPLPAGARGAAGGERCSTPVLPLRVGQRRPWG